MEPPLRFVRNPAITSEAVNALRATAWSGTQRADWDPVLARSLGWICAFDGDVLIGFVNIAWDGGIHAFLLDTTVHGDFQRRGIGTRLISEAADLAREHGIEWLHVDYEPALEGFYAGCGFCPTAAALLHLGQER